MEVRGKMGENGVTMEGLQNGQKDVWSLGYLGEND